MVHLLVVFRRSTLRPVFCIAPNRFIGKRIANKLCGFGVVFAYALLFSVLVISVLLLPLIIAVIMISFDLSGWQ